MYTIKTMPEDVFDRWIEDLLSGEFEQGDSLLHASDDTYCCLGVLNYRLRLVGGTNVYLRTEEGPVYLDMEDQRYLAKMNDDLISFEDIADFLVRERNV